DKNGNPISVQVNPVSAQLFRLFPSPNLNSASGNFISSPEQNDATDQFLVKIDHRLRSSDNLSARYSRTRVDKFFPFTPGQSGTNVPGYGLNDTEANNLVALSYTRVISPTTLNEARFGFTRSNVLLVTQPGPKAAEFGFNTEGPPDSQGNRTNIPNALIDFAKGLADGVLQFVGDSHRNFRTTSYGLFAQDSFKLRHNLTLNYGLRYELNTVLREAHGRVSTWRP